MKWGDLLRVKAEFPINLWPNAAQAYHRWIRTAIRDNTALRPFCPGADHRQRQQFPHAAGEFLPCAAEPTAGDGRQGCRAGLAWREG